MIRHIVLWSFKAEAEGASRQENIARAAELLRQCKQCVPGIVEFEVAVATDGLESNVDLALNSLFTDRAALDAYQVHPDHEKVKAYFGPRRESRQVIDYEVTR